MTVHVQHSNVPVKYDVTDIAWQSVPYGIYSTEPKGHSSDGECYISCMAHDWHAVCFIYPKGGGACALQGSDRQRVLSTHILALQDGKLYWCIYMSPGQCYNKYTVPRSRYCMRFIIFAKLGNNLTTGYICS